MHAIRRRAVLFVIFALGLGLAGTAPAQQPPWPNGCSIGAPAFVQHGLNNIFLGACNRHDRCWAQCNGENPPYRGIGWKLQCDLQLLTEMEAACLAWSGILAFPLGGWDDAGDFLEVCSGVAATFYGAVSTPIGVGIYWTSQCLRGCNPNACGTAGGVPINPLCGFGQCYVANLPPPPGICDFVPCGVGECGHHLSNFCCPQDCNMHCPPAPPRDGPIIR